MLRLLIATALLSSGALQAKSANEDKVNQKIIEYVKGAINVNPNFKLKDVRVRESKPVSDIPGWKVYFLDIDLEIKKKKEVTTVHDKLFSNGKYLSRDFIALANKSSIKNKLVPDLDPSLYRDDHLLYGNKDAKHKIVAFSDPICPFCQGYMPKLIEAAKKHPDKIALYYYHFPLTMLHKEAPTVIKAILAAEKKGVKDVIERVYAAKFALDTSDEKKILDAFNKALKTNITQKDIKDEDILKHYSDDIEAGGKMMISGTPTIYVDGKKDFSRNRYKEFIK
jgi:protein-disulfide isomerase